MLLGFFHCFFLHFVLIFFLFVLQWKDSYRERLSGQGKKNIVITSLNFKCVKFINSVKKEKYYLHSSGPGPTIFYA